MRPRARTFLPILLMVFGLSLAPASCGKVQPGGAGDASPGDGGTTASGAAGHASGGGSGGAAGGGSGHAGSSGSAGLGGAGSGGAGAGGNGVACGDKTCAPGGKCCYACISLCAGPGEACPQAIVDPCLDRDAGAAACGTATCASGEICVHPCCGGAPPLPGTPACTPAPPFCMAELSCRTQSNNACCFSDAGAGCCGLPDKGTLICLCA